MPISPVSSALLPAATRSRAVSMPTSMAAQRPPRGSARGPVVMSAVPGADLARQQAGGGGQFAGHADVDDADLGADLVGEGVADRAAAEEVGDHLAGDLLRPGGDALGVHAVVAGEDRDGGGLRDRRRALAGQAATAARR